MIDVHRRRMGDRPLPAQAGAREGSRLAKAKSAAPWTVQHQEG